MITSDSSFIINSSICTNNSVLHFDGGIMLICHDSSLCITSNNFTDNHVASFTQFIPHLTLPTALLLTLVQLMRVVS